MSDPAVDVPDSTSGLPKVNLDELSRSECWWRDHQVWLQERGYMLRPRYRPGWRPSWKDRPGDLLVLAEDWHPLTHPRILDAVRISDDRLVMIKQIKRSWYPHELEITQFLSADDKRSDPHNYTVPILDVFEVPDDPDLTLIVMPLLRACDSPSWQTVGEAMAFLIQIFEGLQYMHKLRIAHRDCQAPNIMYDPSPMYPRMFHPRIQDRSRDWKSRARHSTRTDNPVRYHYIDFGLSRKYDAEDPAPRAQPIRGGDRTVPEFVNWNGEPLDPFPTDIYYLGNVIRMTVLERFKGAEFLSPLVDDMVQDDPAKRPTIQDAVRRLSDLVKTAGGRKMRARLTPRNEDPGDAFFAKIAHAFRTARYIITRKSAIPIPK
ncbi:hypothetical protein BV20DRAFT_958430 [Pilatotrama ljubarskyi]|nr:hypothetical protein BV20DRAFT_958430 [Pilatotrama ljubarskyi]